MCSVELYLIHNSQCMMHNYERSYNWFPCKFKLPSLGGAGGRLRKLALPLPWGGGGGGYLLNSFTKPFARQPVLRSKNIAVGNTRVLGLFATHWLWGCYEKQGKIQRKIMAKSIAICVILAYVLLHFARWNDADERIIWRRLQDNKP